MTVTIPERHQMCCVCLAELPAEDLIEFIDHGIVLLSCRRHDKITAEMVDKLSQKLYMRRTLTNDKL
jgi:hypothetical protein